MNVVGRIQVEISTNGSGGGWSNHRNAAYAETRMATETGMLMIVLLNLHRIVSSLPSVSKCNYVNKFQLLSDYKLELLNVFKSRQKLSCNSIIHARDLALIERPNALSDIISLILPQKLLLLSLLYK